MSKNNASIKEISDSQERVKGFNPSVRGSELGKSVLIRGENHKQFEDLRAQILNELLPKTKVEELLCEKFIIDAWKHGRAIEVERNLLNEQHSSKSRDPYDEETLLFNKPVRRRVRNIRSIRFDSLEVQKLLKYQIELEKTMHKSLERLREEQKLRMNS